MARTRRPPAGDREGSSTVPVARSPASSAVNATTFPRKTATRLSLRARMSPIGFGTPQPERRQARDTGLSSCGCPCAMRWSARGTRSMPCGRTCTPEPLCRAPQRALRLAWRPSVAAASTDPSGVGQARYDPATGRVTLATIKSLPDWDRSQVVAAYKVFAVDIEVERQPVETLFPAATVSTSRRAHGGGKPVHDWEGAARHVEGWIATHRPLPRDNDGIPILARAVELMTEWL